MSDSPSHRADQPNTANFSARMLDSPLGGLRSDARPATPDCAKKKMPRAPTSPARPLPRSPEARSAPVRLAQERNRLKAVSQHQIANS